ncbi:bulb-type lectin domain-containing protein [Tanacetum coccineum]
MVRSKHVMKHNWLEYKPVQHWYQSQGTEIGVKPIHKHDQVGITRKYLQRSPQRKFPWNSRKKSLSPRCKEMLLKRIKEIEAFNASKESAKAREHGEGSGGTQKEKRARCYICKINLLSLHKIVDNLGGYLCVTLGDKWKTIASLQGLTEDDQEAIKGCYKRFIDMVQVYYETAKKPWYEKKPKEDVVESSSGNARVKDPQGKEKDDAGKEEALEEDMNMKTQFGVRLVGNMEKEAEEGSITDSNDFEVIV